MVKHKIRQYGGRQGVTLFEIVVVAAISCVIMTMAMLMMNRSTRHFQKGTDMLNNQRLMDSIVESIRTDVRSLKRLEHDECNESTFTFYAIRDGQEKKIKYKYDDITKTLFRDEEDRKSNFHGAKQIRSFLFMPELDESGRFKFLNVIMQLISGDDDKYKDKKRASTLSIACQFYSACVEAELNIAKIRETNKPK